MTPAGRTALPNLIVIGAHKCGTSALHYYLDLHPEIQMSSPKELSFFISEQDFDPEPFIGGPDDLKRIAPRPNWSRGTDWYARHFSPEARVRGESTPGYASPWYPGVPGRMAGLVPDAKVVFVVRDPIDRIVSHYLHLQADGRERRPLSEAVRVSGGIYAGRSRYASLLRPFLDRYPRSQILILRQEDLLLRRRDTISGVFEFLGVDERFWSPKMERERNVSARSQRRQITRQLRGSRVGALVYRLPQELKWMIERLNISSARAPRPELDPGQRQALLEELEPEIAGLEELTGWDLSEWRMPQPARAEA